MTSFALGYHNKLVKQGVDPNTDEYYEQVNARMRQVFPDNFENADPVGTKTSKPANVVASATRTVAPKKVTLNKSQVSIAKKLGVPLELYAKQVAMEMRKENG
jgi:predicted HAD superfamily Cof-like phosphohydrolase